MSLYDDQIRARKSIDQENFSESFRQMAEIVDGKKIDDALKNDKENTLNAIGQILKYYRFKPKEVPQDLDNMDDILEYMMRPHGIMRRTVRLNKGWYNEATAPMLVTRKSDGALVALFPMGIKRYCYFDKNSKKLIHNINRKNRDDFDETAITFYESFPLNKMSTWDLIKFIVRQMRLSDLWCMLLAVVTVTLLGMIAPWMNSVLFSDVLSTGNKSLLIGASVLLISASVSRIMVKSIQTLFTNRIGTRLEVNVNAATCIRVTCLPTSFFRRFSAGELAARENTVAKLSRSLVDSILSAGLSAIMSCVYFIQVKKYAPFLVGCTLGIIILTLVVTVITVLLQMRVTKRQMLAESKENGLSYQIISGIQKIKLSGSEKRVFSKWGKMYVKGAELEFDPPFLIKISPAIVLAISQIGYIIGDYIAVKNNMSVSDFYSYCSAYGSMIGAFWELVGVTSVIASIPPMFNMIKPILQEIPEFSDEKEVLKDISGNIEVNNVTFKYNDNGKAIFDNLSLKINPGEYVAIVGKSGCGKSTLIRLLLGFEKPETGAVYYNNKDLNNIDLRSLRRRIGVVLQSGKMFNGDIFTNIIISAPHATMEEAWEAAEMAGIADDIRKMPMGMRTQISEGDGGISGGQRQRILIARAIAPKPSVLFLDEATSALDNKTQKKVSEAMDKLNCTRIVIAHRLSTIKNCDRILVLDQGKIIEDGNYNELMNKNGFFADLVKRQQLDVV